MATFDEKSIFGKREEQNEEVIVEQEEQQEELEESEEEVQEEIKITEPSFWDDSVRVVGEDFVESERARKERIKREKKEVFCFFFM